MMKNAGRSGGGKQFARALIVSQQFKLTFSSVACRPHFVGVWDTVNSVGWIGNPLRLPYTTHNPSIEVGRHAVAIDERRAFFRENLWHPKAKNPTGPKDMLQVWFPGSHGDVGGGYPESDSGLAKIALEWMLREAQAEGLLTIPEREARILGRAGGNYVKPDAKAPVHNSLRGVFGASRNSSRRSNGNAARSTARNLDPAPQDQSLRPPQDPSRRPHPRNRLRPR
jgi:hypothetical protein